MSWLTGKITYGGAMAGALITYLLLLAFAGLGLAAIGTFFTGGTAASVWKKRDKEQMGLLEKNQGKRGYTNVLANAGVGACLSGFALILPEYSSYLAVMMTASFAAAFSDTISSELGNIYGSRYYQVITFKAGRRGNDGVVSKEGSLLGFTASLMMASVYYCFNQQLWWSLMIAVAGFFGNLIDSLLGATLQKKNLLNNHSVNFLNTLAAALLSGVLLYLSTK